MSDKYEITPSGAPKGENRFSNSSGPRGKVNPGSNSKFSASQMIDRMKVHAIAKATGEPTLQGIVDHWKTKYGISITPQSEKEWRANNVDKIDKMKMELVESGELSIPVVSEEVLSDSMLDMALSNAKTHKTVKKQIDNVLRKIDLETDSSESRAKNEHLLKVLDGLQTVYANVNKSITDQIKHLFIFSGKIKIKDNQIRKLVDDRFTEKFNESQESEFSESQEIDDKVREALLKDIDKVEDDE